MIFNSLSVVTCESLCYRWCLIHTLQKVKDIFSSYILNYSVLTSQFFLTHTNESGEALIKLYTEDRFMHQQL